MAEKRTYTLLPEEQCLSQEQIFRYIDGKMTAPEMHAAEKHMLDCGLCSDAAEGLQLVRNREKIAGFVPPVAGNNKEEEKEPGPVIVPIFRRPTFWYSAAAAVTLLLGITVLFRFGANSDMASESKQLAENTSRMADSVSVSPAESNEQSMLRENEKTVSEKDISGEAMTKKSSAELIIPSVESDDAPAPAPPAQAEYYKSFSADQNEGAKENSVVADKIADDEDLSSGSVSRAEAGDDAKKEDRNKLKDIAQKVTESVVSKDKSGNNSRSGLNAQSGASSAPAAAGGASTTDIAMEEKQDTSRPSGPYPLKATDADLDLSYTKGVEMLNAGKAEASLVFFDEVLKKPGHRHYQDAQWKKAEALIILNRKAEAKVLLNDLASKEGPYKNQAQEKLKTL